MGTDGIKFVPITTKEGLKTYTCTETDSDGKTSVFTVIDRDNDGKITNNDGFTVTGKAKLSNKRIQQYLDALQYKEAAKAPIKGTNGEIIILDEVEAGKNTKSGNEYSLGSLAKALGAKNDVASTTQTTASNTAVNPYANAPSYSVDSYSLQSVLNGGCNMLGGMFMNTLNTPGISYQYQMPAFVASLLQALDGVFKMPTYDPSVNSNNSSNDAGNVDNTADGSNSSNSSSISNSDYLNTDETIKEDEIKQKELDAAADKKVNEENDKIKKENEAKEEAKKQAANDAKIKSEKVSKICNALYVAMQGMGTDTPTLRENVINQITKDNVIEVMYEWDQKYSKIMDGESLVESIDNDIYGAQEYTNSLKDKLTARCAENPELAPDAYTFEGIVRSENKAWYTSDSKVEAAFKDMLAKALEKMPELRKYETKKEKEPKAE